MPDTATVSLVVAVLALTGTIVNSLLSAGQNIFLENMKSHKAFQAVVAKHRDPLYTAAADLSASLVNFVDKGFAGYLEGSKAPTPVFCVRTTTRTPPFPSLSIVFAELCVQMAFQTHR